MDKKAFVTLCGNIFKRFGFQKQKNMFFCTGSNGILCGLGLKFSQFGPTCGVMIYYYTDRTNQIADTATPYTYDFVECIEVLSKVTDKGTSFLTGSIDYERYAEEELSICLEKAMATQILPALEDLDVFVQTAVQLRAHYSKDKVKILNELLAVHEGDAGREGCAFLGLRRGSVYLQRHDPCWAVLAADCIGQLKELLGPIAVDIQHVGSTAISGIHAKPILDIAVAVGKLEEIQGLRTLLEHRQIIYRGADQPGQLLFVKGDFERDTRTHHIHVMQSDSEAWENYLNFRDYLNAVPEKAAVYSELKQKLVQDYAEDRAAYTAGKAELVTALLQEAKEWRKAQRNEAG